ncbi:MAG: exodeoxyribonuclease VII small subunit [Kiritimatiellae bacterium]|nr:exodeoxyribonuclease VII small subunit [Kiritimatiellia bacterium]
MSEEKKADAPVSFEAALKRLEEIVEAMESGETDLDKMIGAFEEGQRLVALCNAKLNEVTKKIEKLTRGDDGNTRVVEVDPSALR